MPGRRQGFLPLEKNRRQRASLLKIETPSFYFPTLREDRGRCGINSGSLFGDLNGQGRLLVNFHPLMTSESVMQSTQRSMKILTEFQETRH
jgi:hypothetical protein